MQLREDTARAWAFLHEHPALTGFILVGGTALALHIGHRLSEDLDFAYPDLRLPRDRIKALRRAGLEGGFPFVANDEPNAIEEFELAGMDLLDYQQNYRVADSVRTTFFCPDPEVLVHLAPAAERGPRVASLAEVFAMKCLVAADRSKTRDWFDLYTLMSAHGFTPAQFEAVFAASRVPQKMEIALARMTAGRPHLLDEGYDALSPKPPTPAQMARFFRGVADEARSAAAERALRETRRAAARPQTKSRKR